MTEAEIRKSGRKALVGMRPMTRVGRAVEKGETQGFMKIAVDAETKQILGAAILGVGGDEAIHCILDVMYAKAPYTVLQRAVQHPSDGGRTDTHHSRRIEADGPPRGQPGATGPAATVCTVMALEANSMPFSRNTL